jgi:predicted small lipoprotein YifL
MPCYAFPVNSAARVAVLAISLLALAACGSSAPYTLPSAAINTAIAASASAVQRSAGGCYAQCVGGTVCNPRNGFCESPGAVCIGMESDPPSCLNRPGTTMGTTTPGPAGANGVNDGLFPLGVSPATGTVPPPPGSRP